MINVVSLSFLIPTLLYEPIKSKFLILESNKTTDTTPVINHASSTYFSISFSIPIYFNILNQTNIVRVIPKNERFKILSPIQNKTNTYFFVL